MHPVTGVTGLHVARYARQLDAAGLSPASAARKLAAVSGWYAWLAQRGHIAASPAARIARPRARPGQLAPAGPYPGPGPRARSRADAAPGPQRARTTLWLSCCSPAPGCPRSSAPTSGISAPNGGTGARVTRANGRPEPRTPRPGCFPDRRLSRRAPRPGRRPGAVRHPHRGTAVCRRRAAGRAPPRHAGRPARRPGQPPRTAHDAALIRGAVPRCRPVTPRSPERPGVRRTTHHPAVRPGPAHRGHSPGAASAAAPGTASACIPGPRSKFRTMAWKQASLPRPAASARQGSNPKPARQGGRKPVVNES